MQLAAKAVAQPQHQRWLTELLVLLLAQGSEAAPGLVGLLLMVKTGDVTPGVNPPSQAGQSLEQPPITELGARRQITAADELEQCACV